MLSHLAEGFPESVAKLTMQVIASNWFGRTYLSILLTRSLQLFSVSHARRHTESL